MEGASEYQVALIVTIGTVVMLLLAGAIVLFMLFYQKKMAQEQLKLQRLELDYQQKMMLAALESQENERKRVASDLHDSIGGMLSTIRVGLTTVAKQISDPQLVEQQKQMLDDTISSVRRISRDLMPPTLEKFGLVQAVKEMCERVQSTAYIQVAFSEHGEFRTLEQNQELMIFRIIQELINNAVKHSKSSTINVVFNATDKLEVVVEDDGVGFDATALLSHHAPSSRGLGLFNIENRVRLLNARLEFDNERKAGTRITMIMPL